MEEQHGKDVQPSSQGADESTAGASDPDSRIQALEAELEESGRERNQYKDALLRAQADLTNYKRRADEERGEQLKYANSRLILKILPVLDDFGLAIDHAGKSDAGASWLEGVELIRRKLQNLVDSEAVTRIETEGRDFDPTEHEAMAYQESMDHDEGQVLSVVREGYKLQGRVIRPALVILARKPETNPDGPGPSDEKETEDA
jgi:molecular chaperone GrpE